MEQQYDSGGHIIDIEIRIVKREDASSLVNITVES